MSTVALFSSCALDGAGRPDPFFLQELPWLRAHFDRVLLCSYYGTAWMTEDRPERVAADARGGWSARFRPFFTRECWRELAHLRHDGRLTAANAAKLYLFAVRGQRMRLRARRALRGEQDVTLYSYWMSYDAYAAALCRCDLPPCRAIARGHAFDVDVARNPMNPYLMKKFIVSRLDGVYPISQLASRQLAACVDVPKGKLHVVAMGSRGGETTRRLDPPLFADGALHVVSCASLVPIKRVSLLIDALAAYPGPVSWLHLGGGEQEEALRAQAAEKLKGRKWKITGRVDSEDVLKTYERQPFDLFVNTSENEGVPVSIMEAMRFGLPVLAPNVGGIPELVDEQNGLLFEGGAREIARKLEEFAALPRTRVEAMRAASQKRWNERYRSESLLPLLFPARGAEGTSE